MQSFSLHKRNTKHWDIWSNKERIFRIRGKGCEGTDSTGYFCVIGENSFQGIDYVGFATLTTATAFILDKLMEI